MVSWKELRELIMLYYDMKVLNDAEFLLLYDLYSPQNLDLPCDLYPHFDFQNLTEDELVAKFRFRKTDIPRLSQALRIPDVIICHQGTICEGTEGLCMLLKRSCYPCRYSNMVHLFAKPVPVLCMITNQVLDYIYQAHSHCILQWNHQQLSQANLERFAEVVHRKGAPLNNCFALVDGTVRPICRPGTVNQRLLYNGHKRVHGIKFQSVVTPDGMIANMYGPVEGRKHDAGMLAESHLLDDLRQYAFSLAGQPLCIYGDPAYPIRVHLQCPFRNGVLTPQMEVYNTAMSSVRTSVEWLFGDIINYFKFLDFKKNLKLGLSSVGKMYIVSAILRNGLTCLYGNTTSDFFQCNPPDLETYFAQVLQFRLTVLKIIFNNSSIMVLWCKLATQQ